MLTTTCLRKGNKMDREKEEKTITHNITFYVLCIGCKPCHETLSIDFIELQNEILLQIYNYETLKNGVARTEYIGSIIWRWLMNKISQVRDPIVVKNKYTVPESEVNRILSMMRANGLIKSKKRDNVSYFILTPEGKKSCEEYLLKGIQ